MDDRDLTFGNVRDANRARVERWHPGFPNDGWTGPDWATAAAGEMGEVCGAVKKLRRLDSGIDESNTPGRQDLVDHLAKEIGDTYLYLDLLAAYYGLDTAECIVLAFNKVSVRESMPERLGGIDARAGIPRPGSTIAETLAAIITAGRRDDCESCGPYTCAEHASAAVVDAAREEQLFILERHAADEVIEAARVEERTRAIIALHDFGASLGVRVDLNVWNAIVNVAPAVLRGQWEWVGGKPAPIPHNGNLEAQLSQLCEEMDTRATDGDGGADATALGEFADRLRALLTGRAAPVPADLPAAQ